MDLAAHAANEAVSWSERVLNWSIQEGVLAKASRRNQGNGLNVNGRVLDREECRN